MKVLVFSLMLAGLMGLVRPAASYAYDNCINNNSRACVDARNAFAEHHGGVYPGQYRARYAYRHHHRHHRHDQHRNYR